MDSTIAKSLSKASRRAILCMKGAMEDGRWDPSPERDPLPAMEAMEALADATPPLMDLSLAQDLATLALGAMETGDWSRVSETEISTVQRFNFLASIADEMAPTPSQTALAI